MMWRLCNHAAEETFPAGGIKTSYQEDTGGGCEKSPLKVKRTLSGMKPGGVLFFVVKLSYYE